MANNISGLVVKLVFEQKILAATLVEGSGSILPYITTRPLCSSSLRSSVGVLGFTVIRAELAIIFTIPQLS